MPGGKRSRASQAWVEARAEDPEAVSAFGVARDRLPVARRLIRLRRFRVLELSGALPDPSEQGALLHRSTQFYNPHKETCLLRVAADDPAPVAEGERVVLVTERDGERRPAAERWWRHVTGRAIEVREGTAWVLGFESGADPEACAEDLAVTRERAHGLLAHPCFQDVRICGHDVPLPWLKKPARKRTAARRTVE